ncbi:hypothetical protein GCM10010331_69450 [Streptomyces xanthochromogenes]|nr:hypothetical protein GCM10010331_69450 [Streptomyces xanthochromogenes]
MLQEPGSDRPRFSIRQHVYRLGRLDIHEDGAVGPALAEREFVDAEDPWGLCRHRLSGQLLQEGSPPTMHAQSRA